MLALVERLKEEKSSASRARSPTRASSQAPRLSSDQESRARLTSCTLGTPAWSRASTRGTSDSICVPARLAELYSLFSLLRNRAKRRFRKSLPARLAELYSFGTTKPRSLRRGFGGTQAQLAVCCPSHIRSFRNDKIVIPEARAETANEL